MNTREIMLEVLRTREPRMVIAVNACADALEQLPPRMLSEDDFGQMMAEAMARVGKEEVFAWVTILTSRYGWPLPKDKLGLVAAIVSALVQGQETARGSIH